VLGEGARSHINKIKSLVAGKEPFSVHMQRAGPVRKSSYSPKSKEAYGFFLFSACNQVKNKIFLVAERDR